MVCFVDWQTIMKALYFNWTAHMAVDDPRLHHQLLPDIVQYQPGFSGVSRSKGLQWGE